MFHPFLGLFLLGLIATVVFIFIVLGAIILLGLASGK